MREGKGTYTNNDHPSGFYSFYDGEWKNDMSNGKGVLTFYDSRRYLGDFKNNHYHGTGLLTWPDGDCYEG